MKASMLLAVGLLLLSAVCAAESRADPIWSVAPTRLSLLPGVEGSYVFSREVPLTDVGADEQRWRWQTPSNVLGISAVLVIGERVVSNTAQAEYLTASGREWRDVPSQTVTTTVPGSRTPLLPPGADGYWLATLPAQGPGTIVTIEITVRAR